MKSRRKGFLMIDVMVGIVILSVALISIASAHRYLVVETSETEGRTQAIVVAQNELEQVKKYDKFSNLANPGTLSLPINKTVSVGGRNYIVIIDKVNDAQVTAQAAFITPVQVLVTWTSSANGQDTSLRLFSYLYTKPVDTVPEPAKTSYTGWRVLTYTANTEALGEKKHGWLRTTFSKNYKLWANYLGNDMSDLPDDQKYKNYALTSPWSPSGTFNKTDISSLLSNNWNTDPKNPDTINLDYAPLTFGTVVPHDDANNFFRLGAGDYDFSFQMRNDAVLGHDVDSSTSSDYRNPNEWGLPKKDKSYNWDYTQYKFDLYINGVKVAQNITVISSDTSFNSPDPDLNKDTNIQVDNQINGKKVTVTVVKDENGNPVIRFKNVPDNAMNISIKWTNDRYEPGMKYDANPMIANMTLTKKG